MNIEDIELELCGKFGDIDQRKIVVWFDESKKFYNDLDNLHLYFVHFIILDENSTIYTKYLIEHEYPEDDFLIYIPYKRLPDSENYIADIIYYADEFSTDKVVNLVKDLGIDDKLIDYFKRYSKFFNANTRINKFKSLDIDYSKENIVIAILAVITNQNSLNIDDILKKVVVDEITGKKKIMDQFKKYEILDDLWKIIEKNYGYKKDDPTIQDLMTFLILNYTATFFESKIPKKWDEYLVKNKNNAVVFIDILMNDKKYSQDYDKIAEIIEEDLEIGKSIKNKSIDSYIKCDSFRIFDRKILEYYANLLCSEKTTIDLDFSNIRKNTHFYSEFENEFQSLQWANSFIKYFNEFERNYESSEANEIIDQYLQLGVFIDICYRKFHYYYDKVDNPDYLVVLCQLIDNNYNSFLNRINNDYIKSITKLDSLNDVNIEKQWNLYKDQGFEDIKNKTMIFISDAFRYESALEIKNNFDKEPKKDATLTPIHSTIPSNNSLGIASLLPHNEIEYKKYSVLVNNQSIETFEEKRNFIENNIPNSTLIQYNDLKNLKQDELRSRFKNKKLIFVYHDQIQESGDIISIDNGIFNSSQEFIDEITKIVTKLRNYPGIGTFYITSVNGFIYENDQFEKHENIELPEKDFIDRNQRFLLTDSKTNIEKTYCMSLDYIGISDRYVTIPEDIGVFKQESNIKLEYGGVSLEECILPLLKVKVEVGSKNQKKVELELLTSDDKITNLDTDLTFFQKEKISKNILPLNASTYFVDSNDKKVSNEVKINANVTSEDPKDREFMVRYILKDIDYSTNESYYLIINDSDKNKVINKIEFEIDILFN